MSLNDKKIAILMLCHTLPHQINDFIGLFDPNCFDFHLHVDKKSKIQPSIRKGNNIFLVPDDRRIDVRWGRFSQVEATLLLINQALHTALYDYFWLCSGQDFPIKSVSEIKEFFRQKDCNFVSLYSSRNNPIDGVANTKRDKRCEVVYPSWMIGKGYWQRGIKRLYNLLTGGVGYTFSAIRRNLPDGLKAFYGSQWWCLNQTTIKWISTYIEEHSEILNFYSTTVVPDESFFQTLVMNSPYSNNVSRNFVYMDWTEGKSSPKVLTELDYTTMVASEKLLARKIDSTKFPDMYKKLLQTKEKNRR